MYQIQYQILTNFYFVDNEIEDTVYTNYRAYQSVYILRNVGFNELFRLDKNLLKLNLGPIANCLSSVVHFFFNDHSTLIHLWQSFYDLRCILKYITPTITGAPTQFIFIVTRQSLRDFITTVATQSQLQCHVVRFIQFFFFICFIDTIKKKKSQTSYYTVLVFSRYTPP